MTPIEEYQPSRIDVNKLSANAMADVYIIKLMIIKLYYRID